MLGSYTRNGLDCRLHKINTRHNHAPLQRHETLQCTWSYALCHIYTTNPPPPPPPPFSTLYKILESCRWFDHSASHVASFTCRSSLGCLFFRSVYMCVLFICLFQFLGCFLLIHFHLYPAVVVHSDRHPTQDHFSLLPCAGWT